MTHLFSIALLLALFSTFCSNNQPQAPKGDQAPIKVGVFNGPGGAQNSVWETVEAIKIEPEMEVKLITTSDFANGCLDSLNAIIIPGGGGSRQYLNLGHENHDRIRNFITKEGGAVGICAGAYLFSNTPGYASIAINGAQAIEIEHDNRGYGLAKFTWGAKRLIQGLLLDSSANV